MHLLGAARKTIETEGEAEILLAGRPFTIRKSFIDDLSQQALPESLGQLRRALLVLHSPSDDTVSIDNATEIYQHARHPKSFVSLDGADHLLSRETDACYAGTVLAVWAERYLDQPVADETPLRAGPGEVVARTEAGGFLTELNAAGHGLIADEPQSVGGSNSGPTPVNISR